MNTSNKYPAIGIYSTDGLTAFYVRSGHMRTYDEHTGALVSETPGPSGWLPAVGGRGVLVSEDQVVGYIDYVCRTQEELDRQLELHKETKRLLEIGEARNPGSVDESLHEEIKVLPIQEDGVPMWLTVKYIPESAREKMTPYLERYHIPSADMHLGNTPLIDYISFSSGEWEDERFPPAYLQALKDHYTHYRQAQSGAKEITDITPPRQNRDGRM